MAPNAILAVLALSGAISLLAWLAVLLAPARPWDLHPISEHREPPTAPHAWPRVSILVPARNESAYLPRTLPALLAQDYPGEWGVIVVDDRSEDGTGEVARRLASEAGAPGRLTVISAAAPLPAGWVGKVWALKLAARHASRDAASLPTSSSPMPTSATRKARCAGSWQRAKGPGWR